jgi:hypothetical protein
MRICGDIDASRWPMANQLTAIVVGKVPAAHETLHCTMYSRSANEIQKWSIEPIESVSHSITDILRLVRQPVCAATQPVVVGHVLGRAQGGNRDVLVVEEAVRHSSAHSKTSL